MPKAMMPNQTLTEPHKNGVLVTHTANCVLTSCFSDAHNGFVALQFRGKKLN